MKQAANLNRIKLAYGNCWKKVSPRSGLARKRDFSVLHCFLSVFKKKIFIHGVAVCYLTLPWGKHELLLSSFMSAGVKSKP